MNRTILSGILIFSVLTGVALLGGQQEAMGGHGCYGYHSCSGCYGCDGCFGHYRWLGRRPFFGFHGYSGCYGYSGHYGYSGCYGCSGCSGSYGCHGCSGCYGSGCYGAGYVVPVEPANEATSDAAAAFRNHATLNVSVPTSAKISVNGHLTKSTGKNRSYISRNLRPDIAYTYEVRAEWMLQGNKRQQTKVVEVRAGQTRSVAFDFRSENPVTTLTLNVPEDAKVVLAGAKTETTGVARIFSTKKLASGQEWSDYKIVVTMNRNGQTLTKEQSITLKAGDNQDLTFDFNEERVAVAR